LSRRTDSAFNKIVYKRLNQSNTTRYPISISRLTKLAGAESSKDKILCIVGNVLNDERLLVVPKLNVCALKFSDAARARIVKAGGTCYTFDQLAKIAPTGTNTWLLRAPRRREAQRHWGGAPGIPGDSVAPYVGKGSNRRVERTYKAW
jgi:large subunit ribosomal protein L18e